MLLFWWILALLVAVVVAPRPEEYLSMYTSLLTPMHLMQSDPTVYAPVRPPWPLNRPTSTMSRYRRLIESHDGYISLTAGDHLDSLHTDTTWLIQHPNSPITKEMQGVVLLQMQAAARTARWQMQNALHPTNIRAQHIVPLTMLSDKLDRLLDVLRNPDHLEPLTGQLNRLERLHFAVAHEALLTERILLRAAMPFSNILPPLP